VLGIVYKKDANIIKLQVTSCLARAGNGICNETNRPEAINKHLTCIFGLITEQQFGTCLRDKLLGPIQSAGKSPSLALIRAALPSFVECVRPLVLQKCGEIPLNVFGALGQDAGECPVDVNECRT
jgi:hypothetical protein